ALCMWSPPGRAAAALAPPPTCPGGDPRLRLPGQRGDPRHDRGGEARALAVGVALAAEAEDGLVAALRGSPWHGRGRRQRREDAEAAVARARTRGREAHVLVVGR